MQNIREAITNLLMNGVDRAYDTDLAAAFLVKDEMRKRGFRFSLMQWNPKDAEETWVLFERFSDHPRGAAFGEAEGTDIPRTICEAALDALEAEREHGARLTGQGQERGRVVSQSRAGLPTRARFAS